MKTVSIILVLAYLMLPVLCFGHPCEVFAASSVHSDLASDVPHGCPFNYDTDNCETTCCCAGHIPLSSFTEIPHAAVGAKLLPYEPHLALPRIIDRIFVPPRNHS
ncbi:MAG: hypothetical protein CXR30_04800 [Geobacter sp.]|nr:MAG: hypothetical protein CXR30_04800 [Geobacter sp.]